MHRYFARSFIEYPRATVSNLSFEMINPEKVKSNTTLYSHIMIDTMCLCVIKFFNILVFPLDMKWTYLLFVLSSKDSNSGEMSPFKYQLSIEWLHRRIDFSNRPNNAKDPIFHHFHQVSYLMGGFASGNFIFIFFVASKFRRGIILINQSRVY